MGHEPDTATPKALPPKGIAHPPPGWPAPRAAPAPRPPRDSSPHPAQWSARFSAG